MIEHNGIHPAWPRTIREAVDRLLAALSEENKAEICTLQKPELIRRHFGLGAYIRNHFGLWQGNQVLLDDCGAASADSASTIILEAFWVRLQRDS
jgi:hypothetical protein